MSEISCPVCELKQPLAEFCSQCGVRLAPAPEIPISIERLPELEQTRIEDVGTPIASEPVAGFDRYLIPEPSAPTALAATQKQVPRKVIDLGALPNEPSGPVAIEGHRAIDDGVRTGAPEGGNQCRYCQTVQLVGTICDNCGQRLPIFERRKDLDETDGLITCRDCGGRGIPGGQCRDCGMRLPIESD